MADTLTIPLSPETAEQLRKVASETGETIEDVAQRLLLVGAETDRLEPLTDTQLQDLDRRLAVPGEIVSDEEAEAIFREFGA